VFAQFDPADGDACVPDPGLCTPVPVGGPMIRMLLALVLVLFGTALATRRERRAS
jgi:hypothetical protein